MARIWNRCRGSLDALADLLDRLGWLLDHCPVCLRNGHGTGLCVEARFSAASFLPIGPADDLIWDGAKDTPEQAPQLVFYGIARNYCEANNVVVDPEVDLGRGPVDFKFSNGYVHRAHLEVKKVHNGKFWNGLERQLPSYMSSDEVQKGWFLAVRYRSGRNWDQKVVDLPGRVRAAAKLHGRDLRYALVDARRPASASKL